MKDLDEFYSWYSEEMKRAKRKRAIRDMTLALVFGATLAFFVSIIFLYI